MWSSFSSWRRSSPGALVQLSSERTLEPVRKDCSFAEKQQPQPARPLGVRSGRLVGIGVATATSESEREPVAENLDGERRATCLPGAALARKLADGS